jgi:hypothetical protein
MYYLAVTGTTTGGSFGHGNDGQIRFFLSMEHKKYHAEKQATER